MALLKPKDFAKELGVTPEKVSILANKIESSNLYSFERTPFGSLKFNEKELELIKEYQHIVVFFNQSELIDEMLSYKIDQLFNQTNPTPNWIKFLENADFFK